PVEQPYADTVSVEVATQLLTQRAGDARQIIDGSITAPLTQNQSDALISLVYDIGADAFRQSTLLKRLNAGDTAGAAAEIKKWTKEQRPEGLVEVATLVKRRAAEAELVEKPDPISASFSAVNYSIPGTLPIIAQPSGMTCWGAVMTMLWSWKNNQSMRIHDALASIGRTYAEMFDRGDGLDSRTARALYVDAGLDATEGFNPTIDGWETFLKKY